MGEIKDRLNEIGYNNNGERMTIVRYGNCKDIDIQFDDGTIIENRKYVEFKRGSVKNPMTPSVYCVGYFGIGDYKSRDENGKHTKCYDTWHSVHGRCYDPKLHEKYPTYENCTVCEEWNNYQNYAIWHIENYYEIENEIMTLDKDILKKGNKIYSPDTCVFVPNSINVLFVKSNKIRGEYPIGVSKHGNKLRATLNKCDGKQIYLGTYDTVEEAFFAYKKAKEAYIKEVAEKYKGKIDPRAYEAMMKYEVEITD